MNIFVMQTIKTPEEQRLSQRFQKVVATTTRSVKKNKNHQKNKSMRKLEKRN